MTRKSFRTLGALLRSYAVKKYWERNGQIAIYRLYRFRWFAPTADGSYVATGRVTSSVEGCHCVELEKFGDEP